MEQLFKNSKNIVYKLTSGFFMMACLCLFCIIMETITAVSVGKSPDIVLSLCYGSGLSVLSWASALVEPFQFRFAQKFVQLNPENFRYSTEQKTNKFRDGHTETHYYAFVQIERWGKKIPIVYTFTSPFITNELTSEEMQDPSSYEIKMEAFIKGTECIRYCTSEFKSEEKALQAIELVKNSVKENIQVYAAEHYDIVDSKKTSTVVNSI